MTDVAIVAAFSFAGTAVGGIVGILSANRLTCYRIEQLEKKVEQHNNLDRRVITVEKNVEFLIDQVSELKEDKYV